MTHDLPPLDQIEALFAIELDSTERELLTTPTDLLGIHERQRRYVLMMALTTCQCPACGYLLCQRSAADAPFDPAASTPDDAYACPHCHAGLTWHLGVIGGAQWFTLTAIESAATRQAWLDARRPGIGAMPADPGLMQPADARVEHLEAVIAERVEVLRRYAPPQPAGFTAGQPVEFRDRTRSAEWERGTFTRYDGTEHPGDDAPMAFVAAANGTTVRTEVSRIRPACICEGRGGHTNPACAWYGTDTLGGAR